MTKLGKKRRKKLQDKVDQISGYRSYHDGDVEVSSGKKGHGVFAARQFLPGELVIEITGQLLSKKTYEGSSYVMDLDQQWYLEPGIPAAFLNHSCSPNTELIHLTKRSLGLVAICNIEAETEITFDYQWEPCDWTPRCRCGAPNCRGWVVAKDGVETMRQLAKKTKKQK
ncbi:SET domain protein [Rubripirellula lacrimiformis]|uniref:SET domain protein n=1 Tax=Rubripirellula lacrimiformis TaxID=1930273 RepID=A0A517N3N1_9BACT|nr:SET domain-containing protein [Rubripirellula lacrimiformis]QDT01745.1 SET domain protein [Rubripirellula lacrimiformis]